MRYLILLLLSFALTIDASAQRRGRGYSQVSRYLKQQHNALDDSIGKIGDRYAQCLDSIVAETRSVGKSAAKQHLDNPYFYPLFAGNTLLPMPIRQTIGTIEAMDKDNTYSLVPMSLTYTSWALVEMYATHPELVKMNLAAPDASMVQTLVATVDDSASKTKKDDAKTRQEATQAANAPVSISKEHHNDVDILDLSDFHIHILRPNFWTFKGAFSTQFMQYYVSDNWYKGGDNHVSMLANFNFEANYDNKRKLTFTNKLETKLGFQTSPSDTYHKFKTNADLLRLTDKLGIKAWHHWDYTLMLQSWTQFYKAYQSNSANVTSDFMSPFEAVLSAGMDYKLQKKRVNFTATLSPVAVNLKYCDREALVKNHGIEEGKHHKIDTGSTITVNMTLKFCEQVNWVTRLYAFYDYKEHLKAEWENTINLKINKYLSTKLFLYPRFDNNVTKKNEDDTYLQFNEYLSVGLDLNF